MKVRDTSPGRLYALSSEIGCTAINGAMAADIPAGGQSVILALDKKIVIDGDDAAKFVEVRWGTNTAVGSRPVPSWLSDVLSGLVSIVGEANFDINYIPAENKLYLQFSLEVTTEQIEEVKSLLARVLPSNVVPEIDEMPMTYTRLEYLESTGIQWIDTGIKLSSESEVRCQYLIKEQYSGSSWIYGGEVSSQLNRYGVLAYLSGEQYKNIIYGYCGGNGQLPRLTTVRIETQFNNVISTVLNSERLTVNDKTSKFSSTVDVFEAVNAVVFGFNGNGTIAKSKCRIYSLSISRAGETQVDYVPCLDDTGTPCMFDTVSRTPFKNDGTGDFIIGIETQQQLDNLLDSFPNYTGQAIEKLQINLAEALQTPDNEARLAEAMAQNSTMPAMLSLDGEFVAPKFYAQLTEHGIRRLYHVPKGYMGTMDEYAAVNGFKELVEPPMPVIGYWMPEWRETDTQLILDWVETEPPTEEDTENA